MPRPLRLELPGASYLVCAHTPGDLVLFPDDAARQGFLSLLGSTCRRYRWRCRAYSLLSGAYALTLYTPEANLAAGMRHLNSVYAQVYRRRHGAVGTLFDGRYTSLLVDPQRHLLEAVRRVLQAPVRAGLADDVAAWKWSSYAMTAGARPALDWLSLTEVLAQLGTTSAEARERFIELMNISATEDDAAPQNCGLGDTSFLSQRIAQAPQTLAPTDDEAVGERPSLERFASGYDDRRAAMRAAYASGCYTQREIARHFGVHAATVSRAIALTADWPDMSPPDTCSGSREECSG